jgi:hypothetical protein
MKRIFFRFNLLGSACIVAGGALIIFNIPAYMWFVLLGIVLIVTGIYISR